MNLVLRARKVKFTSDKDPTVYWFSGWLEVVDATTILQEKISSEMIPEYKFMCDAIVSDIQNPSGSGASTLDAIERVETGAAELEELGGNAWYTIIKKDQVSFEGQYEQGQGGGVSLGQYKFAVSTYMEFLSDPERKTIEVNFPKS